MNFLSYEENFVFFLSVHLPGNSIQSSLKIQRGKLEQWGDRTLSQRKNLFYKLLKNDICPQTLMKIIQDAAIVVSEQNLRW
jgi:hypothetical protein